MENDKMMIKYYQNVLKISICKPEMLKMGLHFNIKTVKNHIDLSGYAMIGEVLHYNRESMVKKV